MLQTQSCWNNENEELLKQWGERASVLRVLHGRTAVRYSHRSTMLSIPTIVLSTMVGSLQLRLDGVCQVEESYIEVVLACINLLVATLAALNTLLRYQEKSESHKSSASSFGNFYRQVSCELSFPRKERETPSDLMKSMKRHYDALLECSPEIPQDIISHFKVDPKSKNISLPDVCNGLDPIRICKSNTFFDDDDHLWINILCILAQDWIQVQ